jgi:hypothetical protein
MEKSFDPSNISRSIFAPISIFPQNILMGMSDANTCHSLFGCMKATMEIFIVHEDLELVNN